MYKKIRSHPTTLSIYGKKLSQEGLTSETNLQKRKQTLRILEKEFQSSKNYKSELNGMMEFGQDLNLAWAKIKEVLVVLIKLS